MKIKKILLPILCALQVTPLFSIKNPARESSQQEMYRKKRDLQKAARYSKNIANVLLGTSALTTLALILLIKRRSMLSKISFLDFLQHVMGTKSLLPIVFIEGLILYSSHIFRAGAQILETELTPLEKQLKANQIKKFAKIEKLDNAPCINVISME
jgi:hypothetical protein